MKVEAQMRDLALRMTTGKEDKDQSINLEQGITPLTRTRDKLNMDDKHKKRHHRTLTNRRSKAVIRLNAKL
ncbi:hypothetical protein F2Q68_00008087 [Brassica cretica]|uniref:Uncharacterized protein n=1 Tax=Brassica cretica TaxID=69181 RepID=A0A8S9KMJ7_BRACR|nr:hypothetical protein F2Q68_00008087 [Brassica cretica]